MFLLPAFERLGRRMLHRQGFASRLVMAPASAGGGSIHVFDGVGSGDLPTLVILPGLSSASVAFGATIVRLKKHFRRIVAIDYPGHGFSDAPRDTFTPEHLFEAVTKTLTELVPEPAIVIGNSLGGGVALQYAVRCPENVRALVLLSPAGSRATDSEWERIRKIFEVKTRRDAIAFMDRIYHRPSVLMHLAAHELPGAMNRRSVQDLMATATNDDAPTPEQLSGLKMPILFFWGASERLFSKQQLDYFRENLPKQALVEHPEGFGHCPHFDDPDRLAKRIVDFARSL